MDTGPKNYEIAYFLSSSHAEADVLTYAAKLAALIEENKGTIKHSGTPRKRPLAYPIKKQTQGYFGWITFTLTRALIKNLEKKLKNENDLLRFVIVEEVPVDMRPYRPFPFRQIPQPGPTPVRQPLSEPEKEAPKLDLEALDKKLEEILGK